MLLKRNSPLQSAPIREVICKGKKSKFTTFCPDTRGSTVVMYVQVETDNSINHINSVLLKCGNYIIYAETYSLSK